MREWKLRMLPLALVAIMAAGCGDDGTEPGTDDFDAETVATAAESLMGPMEASSDGQFAAFDFMINVLADGGAALEPRSVVFDRAEVTRQLRTRTPQSLLRQAQATVMFTVPEELYGLTYVYNPDANDGFGAWEVDEARTSAPANGVRAIWYLTNDEGYVTPLQEQGYLDITNVTVAGIPGIRLQIVRTTGGSVTLADYAQGYLPTETTAGWGEQLELEGTFSDGTDEVEVDLHLDAQGSNSTYDETYLWDLQFDGPDGSYSWQLDGSWDESASSYDDAYDISITRGADVTALELDMTGMDGENGTGQLSHNGSTIANIAITESEFAFSRPGGGSFSQQEIADLEGLTYLMFAYGPLLSFAFLFFFFIGF